MLNTNFYVSGVISRLDYILIIFLKMISVRFSDHYISLPNILVKTYLKIETIEGIILK